MIATNTQHLLDEAHDCLLASDGFQAHAYMKAASEQWIIALCDKYAIAWQPLSDLQRIEALAQHAPLKRRKVQFLFDWHCTSLLVTQRQTIHMKSLVRCLGKLEEYMRNDLRRPPCT